MTSDNLFKDYPEVIFMIYFFSYFRSSENRFLALTTSSTYFSLFMLQFTSMFKYKIYYDTKGK